MTGFAWWYINNTDHNIFLQLCKPGVFDSYPDQAVINLFYWYTFVEAICNKVSDTPRCSLSFQMSMFAWKVLVLESINI